MKAGRGGRKRPKSKAQGADMIRTLLAATAAAFIAVPAVQAQEQNIAETAMATSDLSTLVEAVKAADLAETLQGEGPFTVFAPTNAAFEALPEGTLEELLKPEIGRASCR